MTRSLRRVLALVALAAAPIAADDPDPAPIEVTAAWDSERGHGRRDPAVASLPDAILDAILADARAWYAADCDEDTRSIILRLVRDQLAGHGPAAAFDRRRSADGTLEFSDPSGESPWFLSGGPELGYEVGAWAPSSPEPTALEDGYRWVRPWVVQLGETRRAYRVDVDFSATADRRTGRVRYEATWKGPFRQVPLDLGAVAEELRKR